jgi:multidrug efflux pump subunit AcrA (membrane-fusion protein)
MPKEYNDIELKSEEVQEILSTPPEALLRSGISVVFFSIFVLLLFTFLIKYPTIIKGEILLTTEVPPVEMTALNPGKIEKLFVSNKQLVSKDEYLALIANTANFDDIKTLKALLEGLNVEGGFDSLVNSSFSLQLGDIQEDYNNFVAALSALDFYDHHNVNYASNLSLLNQIKDYNQQKDQIYGQISLIANELSMLKDKLDNNRTLFNQGIISKFEFNKIEADYLQKQQQHQSAKMSLSNVEITAKQLGSQIDQNKYNSALKNNENYRRFQITKDLLIAKVKWWEKNYLVVAPIAGQVNFNRNVSENQNVTTAYPMFSIIPPNSEIIGNLFVPLQGSGKIAIGQEVKIDLFNYPAQEFGTLTGKVQTISTLPNEDNMYFVEVALPDTLLTSYKKQLDFIPNMKGNGGIITERQRIISKIFNQFRDLVKNKS